MARVTAEKVLQTKVGILEAANEVLQDQAPVYQLPGTNIFMVTRHADVKQLLKDALKGLGHHTVAEAVVLKVASELVASGITADSLMALAECDKANYFRIYLWNALLR